MSKEQVSISELLLSLDSSELQEAEQVRATISQQLSTDRGTVLSSLVDHYLESSSFQAVLLLSSTREPHHKALLEKLNESLNRPGTRLAGLTLLSHLIQKQPPWVHHISHSALLLSLLRCLKTDGDVMVLITAVLVLVTLLPMIPQAGKQHIYDFFDVFGRLASWSYRNLGNVPVVQQVHLHAAAYSLFHRLYGMFPCNFISYLRLHYSMKENLDTFQEIVKPMLEHVRVHPELVSGTQDHELDPSRWRSYEVHDIVIECARVSLDPLESSCEDDVYSFLRDPSSFSSSFCSSSCSIFSPTSPSLSPPLPILDLTCTESISSTGSSVCPLLSAPITLPQLTFDPCTQADDITWSPSSHCGLSTPPAEPASTGSTLPTSRTSSTSTVKCPSLASVPPPPFSEESQAGRLAADSNNEGTKQPITELELLSTHSVTEELTSEEWHLPPTFTSPQHVLTSSTSCDESPLSPPPPPSTIPRCGTPPNPSCAFGPAQSSQSATPPYEPLFELALPHAAPLFIRRKTQEVLERAVGQQEKAGGRVHGEDREQRPTSVSPLKVLDQLIVHGHDAHEHIRRLSAMDWSHLGGKQQSMKTKGPAVGEELQFLKSQLKLIHSQLQYERFKRQQHAIRNRRLLRRVINATALEEQSVAMRAQLGVQDEEIQSLKRSLEVEQRRYTQLQQDAQKHTNQQHAHVKQLLQQQQNHQRENQRLKSDLQESQSRLNVLEAELQQANNRAYNAEHQLTQLSLRLSSSEQLEQQIILLNQQLVLLRETNRALTEQLEGGEVDHSTEAFMLQCSVVEEIQCLRDNEAQQRQKLELANHRTAELENQLAKKEQLIQEQKKLLEDTKAQSRAELAASNSQCVALRRVTQKLQVEMLHLYGQINKETQSCPLEVHSRPNGGSVFIPDAQSALWLRPSSSFAAGINGALEAVSTSCPHSPLSLSPIESPLAVGSFLEQQARQLFRPTNHSPEEVDELQEEEGPEQEDGEPHPDFPVVGQVVDEATPLSRGPHMEPQNHPAGEPPAPAADQTSAAQQRKHELSIMDYDEMPPES